MFEAVLYFLMEMLHIEYDLVNGIQRSYNYNTNHFFHAGRENSCIIRRLMLAVLIVFISRLRDWQC